MRIQIKTSSPRNKAREIFASLRAEILAGRFRSGEKLPGTRTLAADWGVARATVVMALAMLAADGLVETRPASGSFVLISGRARPATNKATQIRISHWAARLPPMKQASTAAFFTTGLLATDFFPERQWLHAVRTGHRSTSGPTAGAAGYFPLRQAIANHLQYSRGLIATANNIVVVNGSQQALALLCMLLLNPDESAVFENPGFAGIRQAIRAAGALGVPCSIDEEGIILPETPVKMAFVTPASQFPTGITMSHARREYLLGRASKGGMIIVEDEYDSEFTRTPNAAQPLKLIDTEERVVYVGSFSRTMFAALRLGYCLLPDYLVDPFIKAKALFDPVPASLSDQIAMAEFMASGQYRLHVRRMKKLYAERHGALFEGLSRALEGKIRLTPSTAGLSIFGRWLQPTHKFHELASNLARHGVGWQDTAHYYDGTAQNSALFGFSHLSTEQIAAAVENLTHLAKQA
jgi:GntR family transcriptional regulator / MocR family aminotransferase